MSEIAHNHVYDSNFFQDQMGGSSQSARECVPIILSLREAKSVVDVGCGVGGWLAVFRDIGGIQDIVGMDGGYVDRSLLKIPLESFVECDLSRPFSVGKRFDLAISLEVAEHLPREAAEIFISSLTKLSDVVIFSAAIPGQGGTHHVNEQWPVYWRDAFWRNGYVLVDCFRRRLWDNSAVGGCYRQNMFMYVEKAVLEKEPSLLAEHQKEALPLNLVHPNVFRHALSREPSLRRMINALPAAASMALRRRLGYFFPQL